MSEQNTNTGDTGNKTFSQDDVNRIVQERLGKEKTKTEAELAKREQELTQREFLLSAKNTLAEKGLPAELLDALNMSSPEAFEKSLNIFETHTIKNNKIDPAAAELASIKQVELLKSLGIGEYEMELYQFKIDKFAKESGISFEDSAKKYISENPPYKRPPEFATGKGKPISSGVDGTRAAFGLK